MTPIFFYLRPRKIKFKCLPGHIVDAIDVVVVKEQVLSLPVRVAFSLFCALQAVNLRQMRKLPAAPPATFMSSGGSPLPFPR